MKGFRYLLQSFIGVAIIIIGGRVLTDESLKMLSGLCTGIGAAVAALGLGWFIQSLIITNMESEEIKKQKNIQIHDERNTTIREKTGYMVSKIMNYLLCAFVLILGFMGANKIFIIMATCLIIVQFILVIYFSNYYSKKL